MDTETHHFFLLLGCMRAQRPSATLPGPGTEYSPRCLVGAAGLPRRQTIWVFPYRAPAGVVDQFPIIVIGVGGAGGRAFPVPCYPAPVRHFRLAAELQLAAHGLTRLSTASGAAGGSLALGSSAGAGLC
eukprot:scaffold574_cov92-Isochrysis_galbana.AAC.4